MLVNITLLWSLGGDGVSIVLTAAVTIFSGMVIPLPLFPDWAQAVLHFLPFAGIVDTPYRLYTGNYPPSQALPLVVQQLAWVIVLVLLGTVAAGTGDAATRGPGRLTAGDRGQVTGNNGNSTQSTARQARPGSARKRHD